MLRRKNAKNNQELRDKIEVILDPVWYHQQNPDIAEAGMSPQEHFLSTGMAEGRDPSPLFNSEFYYQQNPDIKEAGLSACDHFLTTGGAEGRNPHPLFDSHYYLSTYPDVQELGMNPLLHFLNSGANEGRNPCALFDTSWYMETYQDVAASGVNPLRHYIDHGAQQNYQPNAIFDPAYYTQHISQFPDEGYNPLIHYILSGPASDANPSPLFFQKWYRERNPALLETGQTPLAHFLMTGPEEFQNPNPFFDSWYYQETYFSANQGGKKLFQHYLSTGQFKELNPNSYFLAKWYKENYIDENTPTDLNLTLHYQQCVEQAIQDINNQTPLEKVPNPNPWFDTAWYLLEYQDVLDLKMNPLAHYMEAGSIEGRKPSEDFDPGWYAANLERKGGTLEGLDPLRHFLEHGAISGLAPNSLWQTISDTLAMGSDLSLSFDSAGHPDINPQQYETLKNSTLFDSDWYTDKYLAPTHNTMDPINHYLIFGANLGYNPGPEFNTKAYRSINHDLRSAAINPLLHYIRHGRFEGRHATKENRDNEIKNFRFSQPEYGPITDILAYDSDVQPPSQLNETICLHLHFFHTDMAEEFCDIINRLTVPFTFLVSIQPEEDEAYWTQYFAEHITYAQKLVVKSCPNRGRDVQPWLIEFKDIIRDHDIFCHLHTKKSGYNKFQKSWRRYLTHTTFGTKTLVNQILDIFANDENVGLVFPAYFYILRNQPNYGKNFEQYERLYTTLFGNLPDKECPDYPAGSFFWARTKTLEPLLSLDLTLEDFDEEDGQIDGTIAHALERILGSLPEYTGHTKRCIAVDVPFDLTRYIHPARIETLSPELYLPSSFNVIKEDEHPLPASKSKVAVYTAITGGYENLVRPLIINPDIDYFIFTDTPEKFNPDWAQVIQSPYISDKPVRTARYIKTHAHFWFADYDYAIWIDANVLPVTTMLPIIEKIKNTGYHAAFIQHPLRYNCMEEGNELIKFGIDDQALIEEQLTRYGVIPEIFGEELIETNLFICRPHLKITKEFMTLWWSELNNYSHRDQLSVNYAILKSGLKWTPLFEDNISIRDHPDFFLLEHELHNRDEFIEKITSKIEPQSIRKSVPEQEENSQESL